MESTGIMQKIRELLASGMSSREVIDTGYAPGSVYKVQRQLRRKADIGLRKANESPQATPIMEGVPSPRVSLNALIDELEHRQEDNESLQSEVERLQRIEEEASRMRSQLSALTDQLESVRSERARLDGRVEQLTNESRRLERQLHEARMENIRLKGYLGSKNCQWEHDFALYLRRRQQPYISTCTCQRSSSCVPHTGIPFRARVCGHERHLQT